MFRRSTRIDLVSTSLGNKMHLLFRTQRLYVNVQIAHQPLRPLQDEAIQQGISELKYVRTARVMLCPI